MIHVHKDFDAVPKSLQLTEEEYELLKQGKELDKSYYEQDVLDALTEVYGGKCGYCKEEIFSKNINRANIIHYRPLSLYPWLKYEWSNLLFVCHSCFKSYKLFKNKDSIYDDYANNILQDIKLWRANSSFFLKEELRILHPEVDYPDKYLVLEKDGVLYPKDGSLRGLTTIEVFNLNRDELITNRQKQFDAFRKEKNKKEIFIKEISIYNVRHLKNIFINIGTNRKKHLIVTGKNGSGKTSILEHLVIFFEKVFGMGYVSKDYIVSYHNERGAIRMGEEIGVYTSFNEQYYNIKDKRSKNEFLIKYFSVERNIEEQNIISGITNGIDLKSYEVDTRKKSINKYLIQYLINLNASKLSAIVNNDKDRVNSIEKWFSSFTQILKDIFEDDTLKLDFPINGVSFGFKLVSKKQHLYIEDFSILPSGYKAFLFIVSEIILSIIARQEHTHIFDIEGVVMIDEVDIHLHVELQKKIMPLLTTFFPKIQFIVTTHSPFVLNSIENTVIFDLETNMRIEDASSISYSGLVEGFFKVSDEYSDIIKRKVKRYEKLVNMDKWTEGEGKELVDLNTELENLSPLLSKEIYLKFKDIQKLVFQG